MIHAIARQESQFAQNAGERRRRTRADAADARHRATSRRASSAWLHSSSALIEDAGFNIRLGGS